MLDEDVLTQGLRYPLDVGKGEMRHLVWRLRKVVHISSVGGPGSAESGGVEEGADGHEDDIGRTSYQILLGSG